MVIAGCAGWEWARLGSATQPAVWFFTALLVGLMVVPFWLLPLSPSVLNGIAWLAVPFWVVVVPCWLARGWPRLSGLAHGLLGIVVLVPACLSLALLRNDAVGHGSLLMLLAVVWIADSAAYFSGKRFGRHKLAPKVSPGKTWEGVFGGLTAVAVYVMLGTHFGGWSQQGWSMLLALGLLVPLAGLSVLGDLYESWLKRQAGVKDSGALLPGHGGVLDRIDALLPVLAVAPLILGGGH